MIACSIFALSLRHKSLGTDISLSFIYNDFFIFIIQRKIYIVKILLKLNFINIYSPFSLELIIFRKYNDIFQSDSFFFIFFL